MTKIEFISFGLIGWQDYSYWKTQDKKTLKNIDSLILEIFRSPFVGIGKPEPLIGDLTGYWSRRINDKERLVYKVAGNTIFIAKCHGHYGDK